MIEHAVSEIAPLSGPRRRAACWARVARRCTGGAHWRRSGRRGPGRRRRDALAGGARGGARAAAGKRFVDCSPAHVYAALLDEGTCLASERTMYRLPPPAAGSGTPRPADPPALRGTGAAGERADEVWSWDITKLLGPATWTYFYLFVIRDIYSRYVVGWTVQHQETAPLAERLIAETLAKQQIPRHQLTIHADRGSAMRSKPVAFLLADLGVTKTHSRPYTSTDNPYSEAQFKTLKLPARVPRRFDSILHARAFCRQFFPWYNEVHRHSGIGLMTPATVHHGLAEQTHAARQVVLDAAYTANPDRFIRRPPRPPALPTGAWINQPKTEEPTH